jgi:transcriptional regulator with XRE-family HTH domain
MPYQSIQLPPNRLRELRKAQEVELELYDLSARYRVNPSTVHRWETGLSPVPDHVKLDLADFYGVTVAYLMGWPETARARAAA